MYPIPRAVRPASIWSYPIPRASGTTARRSYPYPEQCGAYPYPNTFTRVLTYKDHNVIYLHPNSKQLITCFEEFREEDDDGGHDDDGGGGASTSLLPQQSAASKKRPSAVSGRAKRQKT